MAKPNTVSKEQLIQSAKEIISKCGIDKLTLKAVAEGASVTQGTVYYHFKTKDQLLLEIVEDICHESWTEVDGMEQQHQNKLRKALFSAKNRISEDASYHKIFLSLVVMSLKSPEMKERIGSLLNYENHTLTKQLDNLNLSIKGISNETLGILLNSMIDGLAIQALVNPNFSVEEVFQELENFISILK